MDAKLHRGVLALEVRERADQQGNRIQRVHHQGDLRLEAAGDALRLCAERCQLLEDPAGAGKQRPARVGQHRTVSAAVKQGRADLVLQLLDRVRDGGLGAVQGSRRGREAAGFRDLAEDAQLVDGHGFHLVYQIIRW